MSAKRPVELDRLILNKLLKWKNSPYRKPLILKGVRQVGKTWILKEFGRHYYENTAFFPGGFSSASISRTTSDSSCAISDDRPRNRLVAQKQFLLLHRSTPLKNVDVDSGI